MINVVRVFKHIYHIYIRVGKYGDTYYFDIDILKTTPLICRDYTF